MLYILIFSNEFVENPRPIQIFEAQENSDSPKTLQRKLPLIALQNTAGSAELARIVENIEGI